MFLKDRINAFVSLGKRLASLSDQQVNDLALAAQNQNAWFTKRSILMAIQGILKFLSEETLIEWTSVYDLKPNQRRNIGLVAAGNLPLVGFHDLMCVLLSGHTLMMKPSSEDQILMNFVLNQLADISPDMGESITIVERLNDADAYIATGSDNTARYFRYYFKDKPHVIRGNRTSVALLRGDESDENLQALGNDVFEYYGLGCRNVSKVFVPEGYDMTNLLDQWSSFEYIGDHHKYRNNYDYNKSIYLVNKEPHLDNGFVLLKESDQLVSPISVLYYSYYKDDKDLYALVNDNQDKIQCVVSKDDVPFGMAQYPCVDDYADGVDTLKFLSGL